MLVLILVFNLICNGLLSYPFKPSYLRINRRNRFLTALSAKKKKSLVSDDLLTVLEDETSHDEKISRKLDNTLPKDLSSTKKVSKSILNKETVEARITLEESSHDGDLQFTESAVKDEKLERRSKPSSKMRLVESSQPDFVMLGLEGVSLTLGNNQILRNCSFAVSTGERIGLVGPNGAGKSTQLKILAELMDPTDGKILKSSSSLRIAFLRQEFTDELVMERSLKDEMMTAFKEEQALLEKISALQDSLQNVIDDTNAMEAILIKLQESQDQAVSKGAYNLDTKILKVLDSMGFSVDDLNSRVDSFSGGWRMRIGLAKIFCQDPNVLLLDEPTNHMDLDSVIWLESFLRKQNLPMVIVSHDREFLDQVCNKVVEVEEGCTVTYENSNYSKFLELRKIRLELWRDKYEKQMKFVSDEEKWIKKAKNEPSMVNAISSKEQALEKFKLSSDWIEPPPKDKKFRFRFPISTRSASLVLEAKNLSMGFGEGKYKTLFQKVSFEVERGQRIGFLGPNGSGKSTMLKIIMGFETPKDGYVEFGSGSVEVNYYAQNQADQLDLDQTIIDAVQEDVPEDFSLTDIRGLIGQFMFKGDDVYKKIRSLSGGEKARVALCKMMLKPANLLLMDEPTNHLDISAKEVLEDALLHYGGSVLIVSHDRYFMSQVVNTIFNFDSKTVTKFDCDYHDYINSHLQAEQLKDVVESRYVSGDKYRITNAKPVVVEETVKKSKNFGGSGVTSGNLMKGIKNAKRFSGL